MQGPSAAVSDAPEAPEQEVRLAREITLMDATMMGVGALMGGGVFVLIGLAAGVAGPALLLALFLNGFITIPTLLVYAELGSASDDAGGGYLWVKHGLGKAPGFLGGWLSWFSHTIACSLYAIASAAFILVLGALGGWISHEPLLLSHGIALGLLAFFVSMNYAGVKIGIKAENVVNTVVLLVVLVFIGIGLYKVYEAPELAKFNLLPFFGGATPSVGMQQVFLAMGITFIAFEGYEIISQTSEEIKNPRRNIPRAIWASFLIAWIVMLLIAFVALAAPTTMDGTQAWRLLGSLDERALVVVSDQVMPYGTVIITGAALLLQLTALNATLYSSSRVSYAMGRDRNLPKMFSRVHIRRRTPHIAVLGSGAIAIGMALFPIETVAASADVMFLLLFLLVNVAYIKLRKTIPAGRFGVRAPFFPYIPIIGIGTKLFLAVFLYAYSPMAWWITLSWIGLGALVYMFYVRKRASSATPGELPLPVGPLPMALASPRKSHRILVLLTSPAPSTARGLARAAALAAQSLDAEVILLQPLLIPEVTPLAEKRQTKQDRMLMDEARSAVPAAYFAKTMVRIGHNLDRIVREAAEDEKATLLMMSAQGRPTLGQPTSGLLVYPPCDVALVRLKRPHVTAKHVLVTAQGSHHAPLSIRLGTAMAAADEGHATLLHAVRPSDALEHREAWTQTMADHHTVGGPVTQDVRKGEAVPMILEAARQADLVVIGATTLARPWRKSILGPKSQEILDRANANVMVVSAAEGRGRGWLGRTFMAVLRYVQPE